MVHAYKGVGNGKEKQHTNKGRDHAHMTKEKKNDEYDGVYDKATGGRAGSLLW